MKCVQNKRYENYWSYRLHKPDTPYAFRMGRMCKFNTHQKRENINQMCTKKGSHLQCVNNHYAKFEYKGMKTVGVTDTI